MVIKGEPESIANYFFDFLLSRLKSLIEIYISAVDNL